jgi:hypothetical protein
MKKLMTFLLTFTLLSITHALAEGEKVITLKDGTRVNGRVVALDRGEYVVESATLGQIRVNENNIVSISNPNMPVEAVQPQAAPQTLPAKYTADMNQMQSQIMADPDLMKEIAALADDPQILMLLNDPAMLQAIQNKDPQSMQSNPRTYELMNHPKMRALIDKIEGAK